MQIIKEVTSKRMVLMEQIHVGGNEFVNHHRLKRNNQKEGTMFKRLAIVVFCIGLMAFWSTDVKAWPASSSGWYVKTGSIIVGSDWVQISNTEIKPTSLVVSIYPTVLVYYKNPAGNEGGVGTPFNFNIPLVGFDSLNPLEGRGKDSSTVEFDITLQMLTEMGINLADYSPNPKWEAYGDPVVTGLDVKIQAYADVSDFCDASNTPESDWTSCYYNVDFGLYEEEVVHLEGLCSVQGDIFNCVESEHWEWSKKDPLWP